MRHPYTPRSRLNFISNFCSLKRGVVFSFFFLQVCTTALRDSYTYCRDYLLIANFVVMALVPFLLLIILNSLTFRIIRSIVLTLQMCKL